MDSDIDIVVYVSYVRKDNRCWTERRGVEGLERNKVRIAERIGVGRGVFIFCYVVRSELGVRGHLIIRYMGNFVLVPV